VAQRFDYESTVRLLVDRGLDEEVVRFNSILEPHLDFIRETMIERLRPSRPLIGLHVGNFVGISLAAFADAVRSIEPDCTVVAVDPNFDTPGLPNPQQHVIASLGLCGLLDSVLLITGYSFERTEHTDDDRDSAVDVLPQLGRLGLRFDTALVDGNHLGETVSRELEWLRPRLNKGGLVFLDDVTDAWHEIRDVFNSVSGDTSTGFTAVGHDGRIGVLQRV
jgi:hypothetical protein